MALWAIYFTCVDDLSPLSSEARMKSSPNTVITLDFIVSIRLGTIRFFSVPIDPYIKYPIKITVFRVQPDRLYSFAPLSGHNPSDHRKMAGIGVFKALRHGTRFGALRLGKGAPGLIKTACTGYDLPIIST